MLLLKSIGRSPRAALGLLVLGLVGCAPPPQAPIAHPSFHCVSDGVKPTSLRIPLTGGPFVLRGVLRYRAGTQGYDNSGPAVRTDYPPDLPDTSRAVFTFLEDGRAFSNDYRRSSEVLRFSYEQSEPEFPLLHFGLPAFSGLRPWDFEIRYIDERLAVRLGNAQQRHWVERDGEFDHDFDAIELGCVNSVFDFTNVTVEPIDPSAVPPL